MSNQPDASPERIEGVRRALAELSTPRGPELTAMAPEAMAAHLYDAAIDLLAAYDNLASAQFPDRDFGEIHPIFILGVYFMQAVESGCR